MTLSALKTQTAQRFRAAGLDTPDLDARLLIMHAGQWTASDLIMHSDDNITDDMASDIDALIKRRLSGEPIDHILGYREFYGRRFHVTQDVLSPRPETEALVDHALQAAAQIPTPRFLDLGTGSGAIIISLLAENPKALGTASDISEAALNIAAENAKAHGTADRLTLLQSSWFESIPGQYDVILSNPPYITDAAMDTLSLEVKNFDPDAALRGGPDGLAPYRDIIPAASTYLKPGGSLMFEIGYDQGAAVTGLLERENFKNIRLFADLSGHDRIMTSQK